MIINELYQTKIECVKDNTTTPYYNVNIDATDVKVIVSLIDFNGAAVSNKAVTLTCDRGTFTTAKSGSSTSITNNGKTFTGTTGSDGKISVLYTASEWGLATFSTNNITAQCNVTGWKSVAGNGTTYTILQNKNNVKLLLNGWTSSQVSTSWNQLGGSAYASTVKPNQYIFATYVAQGLYFRINPVGEIHYRAITGNVGAVPIYLQIDWTIN